MLLVILETIRAPSSGGIVVNVPSSVSGGAVFTGSTYKPGLFDTLPFIRLEGISVDTMYTIVLALMLVYSAILLYPLLTQGPLFRRISGNNNDKIFKMIVRISLGIKIWEFKYYLICRSINESWRLYFGKDGCFREGSKEVHF